MAKHRKGEEDDNSFSGDLTEGELKPQLAERTNPLDGLAEVSQSPIETW